MAAELRPECEGAGLWPRGTSKAAGLRDLGADFLGVGRPVPRLGAFEVDGPSMLSSPSLRAVFGRPLLLLNPGELFRDLFRLFDFNGPGKETKRN